MTRTLTAAVALAAALGMSGLAQAQTSTSPPGQPSTMAPNTPSTNMNPPTTSMGGTQTPATQTPQATYQTTPGQTNQGQTYQTPASQAQMNQSMEPASQSQIMQAQQQLKSEGLYRGSVDGIMGPETQTALSRFQREQGLPETSQLDQQTLGRLSGGGSTTGATGARPMTGQQTGTPQSQSMSPSYSGATQNPAGQNSPTSGNR